MKWIFLIVAILLIVFFLAWRSFLKSAKNNDATPPLTRTRFYWGKQKTLPDDFLEKKD